MNAKSSVEAVIFDLGRVLVDVDIRRLSHSVLAQWPDKDPEQVAEQVMKDNLMVRYNTGQIRPEEFHAALCKKYGLSIGYEEFARLWCGIFRPMEGMEEIVYRLQDRIRLGLLSDTDPLHWSYLSCNFPFLSVFSQPTLSFQVGVMKPDKQIYLQASRNVGTPLEKCLYIDDLSINVSGAKAAGMQAVQFTGPDHLCVLLEDLGLL
ncbi:MAG: HAD family phosphatase [Sedimentisphaerales bacterium]|nr:HAD family phosphatase [Sedimentisphaerales bacterium]